MSLERGEVTHLSGIAFLHYLTTYNNDITQTVPQVSWTRILLADALPLTVVFSELAYSLAPTPRRFYRISVIKQKLIVTILSLCQTDLDQHSRQPNGEKRLWFVFHLELKSQERLIPSICRFRFRLLRLAELSSPQEVYSTEIASKDRCDGYRLRVFSSEQHIPSASQVDTE